MQEHQRNGRTLQVKERVLGVIIIMIPRTEKSMGNCIIGIVLKTLEV